MMNDPIERRKRTRQPMQRELRYRRLDCRGPIAGGTTLNIRHHALAFEGSVPPVAEAGSTLRLGATGAVVRADGRVMVEEGEVAAFAPDVGLAA